MTTTNAIRFVEHFKIGIAGHASLVVKQMKLDGTEFALIAYTPAGFDIAPTVFVRGTLDACRSHYRAAKAWMAQNGFKK